MISKGFNNYLDLLISTDYNILFHPRESISKKDFWKYDYLITRLYFELFKQKSEA